MIHSLLDIYQKKFSYQDFYKILFTNIHDFPEDFIKSDNFLNGIILSNREVKPDYEILTRKGDIRIDLPVWFGSPDSPVKVVIVGMEPRDSDWSGRLNVERVENRVFATPFALERNKGPYYSAFKNIMNGEGNFIYFTDVVKEFECTKDKKVDDLYARKWFNKKAENGKDFLLQELSIISPNLIVALGNDSYTFLKGFLGSSFNIEKIRHPANGGSKKQKKG